MNRERVPPPCPVTRHTTVPRATNPECLEHSWGITEASRAKGAPGPAPDPARTAVPRLVDPARGYAAARSRAIGPTTALWHAVEMHRPPAEVDNACELTVCGVLARIVSGRQWPTAARDVCPVCLSVSR